MYYLTMYDVQFTTLEDVLFCNAGSAYCQGIVCLRSDWLNHRLITA